MLGVAGAATTAQGVCSARGGRGWIGPAAVVLLALIGGTPGEADAQSVGFDAEHRAVERRAIGLSSTPVSVHREDDGDGGLAMGPVVAPQSAAPSVNRIGLAEGDSTYYRGDVVRVRVGFTPRATPAKPS